jgi:hypothetical protein
MPRPRPGKPVVCPQCGQRGDEAPGLRLREYAHLEAVFISNADGSDLEPISGDALPQLLECQRCGWARSVLRGSVEVRKP